MSHQPFLAELASFLDEDSSVFTPDFVLENNPNWNSLGIVSTIALIDEYYDIQLSSKTLYGCKTIGELLAAIDDTKQG